MTHTRKQDNGRGAARRRSTLGFRGVRGGFTIIELMVAVSVLSLMLFLINTLFFQTTQAVSTGVRTSALLANARATNDRIIRDASTMLGPNASNPVPEGGGYIVIINKEVQAPVLRRDGTTVIETFRVDQIAYMASATAPDSRVKRFRATAPRNFAAFGSDFTSPYAIVRYAHGLRTSRNGSPPTHAELGGTPATGGTPEENTKNWGRDAGLDRLANDWMLGRQSVLFAPTDSNGNGINAGAGDWHTNLPWSTEVVQNSGGNLMFQGQCDVTIIPPAGPNPGPNPGFTDSALDPNNAGLTPVGITTNYLGLTSVFVRQQLNPIPDNPATNFDAPLIGQTHAVFAPNCSDFIIQFAADVNNDGEIDRVGPNGLNDGTFLNGDPIFWYDMDSIDQLDGNYDGNVGDLWATTDWTGTTVPSPYVDVTGTAHGQHAFIFRYEDDQAYTETTPGNGDVDNSKWPYMIRIRYRLHDAPGKLESNATSRLFDNKNNDPGNDGAIDEQDEAVVSGRYFETIIRVPRPE